MYFREFIVSCTLALTLSPVSAFAAEDSTLDVGNPINPYDFVGELHNKALDAAIVDAEALSEGKIIRSAEMIGKVKDYVEAAGYGGPGGIDVPFSIVVRAQKADSLESLIELGDERYGMMVRIEETMSNPGLSLEQKIDDIRRIELEILQTFGETEGMPMLVTASVARHSGQYWRNHYRGDSAWNLDGIDDINPEDYYLLIGADLRAAAICATFQYINNGGQVDWGDVVTVAGIASFLTALESLL